MGQRNHSAEGIDADPLQACHHHLGLRRLQYLAVHPVLHHRQRRPVLYRRGGAQPLWRRDPGRDREKPRAVVDGVRDPDRLWFRRRRQTDLTVAVAALLWIFTGSVGWPQAAAPPLSPE